MVTVDENKCGTCGRCVAFCPREALSVTSRWGYLTIDEEKCTDCFGGSYHFDENPPLINKGAILDQNQTNWTRLCTINCPVSALSVLQPV